MSKSTDHLERHELVQRLDSDRDSYARLSADCLLAGRLDDAMHYARRSADADRQHLFLIFGGVKTAEMAELYPDVR
jgi:hypothetical protein